MKPSFATDGTLVYAIPGASAQPSGELVPTLRNLIGQYKEVRFAKFAIPADIHSHTLTKQQEITHIKKVDGFPHAQTLNKFDFSSLAGVANDAAASERAVWRLCTILFDPVNVACEDMLGGMSDEQVKEYEPRLSMDVFSTFLAELAGPFVEKQLKQTKNPETKALLHLTINDVNGAAEVLAHAKNFRLATLIAQLPSPTDDSRNIMKTQIEAWQNRNDWSEMSEPVRALYSILAGEVCIVQGKSGAAENRANEISISERFGLDWTQSLGLRVFFGGCQSLNEAVGTYVEDLESGLEVVRPAPRWAQDVYQNDDAREDTLMGLLRLSASSNADLAAIFDPKSVSGSAVNSRLAWQLATLLRAKGIDLPAEKMDQLTVSFAAALEAADQLIAAAWVLLHLHHSVSRATAVRDLLQRSGGKISNPSSDSDEQHKGVFETLAHDIHIPAPMLWAAKALHARAELHDPRLQTLYLLHAGLVDDAHDVLCSTVGPTAVIQEDLATLITGVIDHFSKKKKPESWTEGGQVFADFARLMHMSQKTSREAHTVLGRLHHGLNRMKTNRLPHMSLEERVAMVEMERVLREDWKDSGADLFDGEEMDLDHSTAGMGTMNGDGMDAFELYQMAMGLVAL